MTSFGMICTKLPHTESPLITKVIDKIMNPFAIISLFSTMEEADIDVFGSKDIDRIECSESF
jgi:hypothetical protein